MTNYERYIEFGYAEFNTKDEAEFFCSNYGGVVHYSPITKFWVALA